MQAFAALLDRLVLTPQRNVKLRLLVDYFRATPDPDRGYALAALTGELDIPSVKPAMLRALVDRAGRRGAVRLFLRLCRRPRRDDLADLAGGRRDARGDAPGDGMTPSLLPLAGGGAADCAGGEPAASARGGSDRLTQRPLPLKGGGGRGSSTAIRSDASPLAGRGSDDAPPRRPSSSACRRPRGAEGPRLVERWLDRLDATGRWALIKLVTGGLRIGVSARLAKQALADFGGKPSTRSRRSGTASRRPTATLFAWLEGRGADAGVDDPGAVPPGDAVARASPTTELTLITPDDYAAEWKWDGIRVQAVREDGVARLYTRTGDDISRTFPDLVDALDFDGALDGELLIGARDEAGFALGSFSDLQQRLNRKTVSAKLIESHPGLPPRLRLPGRRRRGHPRPALPRAARSGWRRWSARSLSRRIDLSPLLPFADGAELARAPRARRPTR